MSLQRILRSERINNETELLPSVPAAPRDTRHGAALRPDLTDHPAPGLRGRAAGPRGRPVALHRPQCRRLRGQHRGHLHGPIQRPLQELSAPCGRQQHQLQKVTRLLPLPRQEQGGAPAPAARGRRLS